MGIVESRDPEQEGRLWIADRQQRTERVLAEVLGPAAAVPARLAEAMRYSVLGGGKRIRALLAYAAGELTEADTGDVDAVACALELLHAYSLIHDDLPCMDDDVLRRGRPTCHVQFDEATALLAGDALQGLAFEVLAKPSRRIAPAVQLGMLAFFAEAVGRRGMAGGQAVDLASVGQRLDIEALESMHRMKTGALIGAAIRLGAACGRAQTAGRIASLDRFARQIGLAFQVVDDVLDVESSAAELGKTPGKDALQDKPTYVSLLGLEAAREHAASLHADALAALATFGEPARRLAEIARWIVRRRT